MIYKKTYEEIIPEYLYISKSREFRDNCDTHRREIIKELSKTLSRDQIILIDFTGYPVYSWKRIKKDQYLFICNDKFELREYSPRLDKMARKLGTFESDYSGIWRKVE